MVPNAYVKIIERTIAATNIIIPFLVSPCTTWPIPGKKKEIIAATIGLTVIPLHNSIKKTNTKLSYYVYINIENI